MKEVLYDWMGLNSYLFNIINSTFGTEQYRFWVNLFDDLGGYYDIHYTIFASFLFTGLSLLLSRHDTPKFKRRMQLWLKFYITVFVAEFLGLGLIYIMKGYFAFPRPFCSNLPFDVNISQKVMDVVPCMKSFPSGHTAFSSVTVASLWHVLNRFGKTLGVMFVLLVMISRVAAGVHYPADLFWALIICIAITIYVKKIVKKVLQDNLYQKDIFNIDITAKSKI